MRAEKRIGKTFKGQVSKAQKNLVALVGNQPAQQPIHAKTMSGIFRKYLDSILEEYIEMRSIRVI